MNTQYNQPTFAPFDVSPQPSDASFQAIYGGDEGAQDITETDSTDEYGSMSVSTVDDDDMPNSDPEDDGMDEDERDEDDMDDGDEDDSGELEPETPDEMPDTRVPDTEMPSQRDMRM
jgi:hypothetical protein